MIREFVNLRKEIAKGKKLAGTFVRIERNPAIFYIAKEAGLDCVVFDAEHGAYNIETLHDLLSTANALEVPAIVRIPEGTKDFVSRTLDAGASGIVVPMVGTAEYARKIAFYAKYPDIGSRGYTSSSGHTQYTSFAKHVELMKEANERILVIVQIETLDGVDNVDEIAAVDGIDMLFIGPNDLSVALGIPGDLTNPKELEAIKKVSDAAKRHNKGFAMAAGKGLCEKFKNELDLFVLGADAAMLFSGMKDVRETVDGFIAEKEED